MIVTASPPPPRPGLPLVPVLTALGFVAILWLAQSVLIPFSLACYLAFVLTPPMKLLERAGLPRLLAVVVTVSLLLGALGGLGMVLAYQVEELSTQLATYTSSMRRKVADVRQGRHGPLALLETTINRVGEDLEEKGSDARTAAPVRIVPGPTSAWTRLEALASPVLRGLGSVAIVFVLVVFMLSRREDLRDRLIRLVGSGRVTLATRTMDEAVQRITRFLLALSLINVGFGALVAAGLTWIGVP